MGRTGFVDDDEVIGMFLNEKLTVREIARVQDCAESTIYAVLRRNGVAVQKRPSEYDPDPRLDALIDEYYSSPQPVALIAAKHRVPVSRLYRELGVRGLERRRRCGGEPVDPRTARAVSDG